MTMDAVQCDACEYCSYYGGCLALLCTAVVSFAVVGTLGTDLRERQ